MRPLVRDVQSAALEYYWDLEDGWLTSDAKYRYVAWPRQVAMTVAVRITGRSLPQVGRLFGRRHHTTVMWSVRATERRRQSRPEIAAAVEAITELALRRAEFRATRQLNG